MEFSEGSHTDITEPYYYETAYKLLESPSIMIPMNEAGQCVLSNHSEKLNKCGKPDNWACSVACKLPNKEETDAIFYAVKVFQSNSYEEIRDSIHFSDEGCPHHHNPDRKGHPLPCSVENCMSVFRLV